MLTYQHVLLIFILQSYSIPTAYGWKEWSGWSRETKCSVSCGQGSKYQKRYCRSIGDEFINATYRSMAVDGCPGSQLKSTPCFEYKCPIEKPTCNCGCILTANQGIIKSRVNQNPNEPQIRCDWSIKTQTGTKIRLRIDKLASGRLFTFSSQSIQPDTTIIARESLNRLPITIDSRNNLMNVTIYYHEAIHSKGGIDLEATYESIKVEVLQNESKKSPASNIAVVAICACAVIIIIVVFVLVYRKCTKRHGEKTCDTLEVGAEDNESSSCSSYRSAKHKQHHHSNEDRSLLSLEKRSSNNGNPVLSRGYPDGGREVYTPHHVNQEGYMTQPQMLWTAHQVRQGEYMTANVQPNIGYLIKQGQLPFPQQSAIIMPAYKNQVQVIASDSYSHSGTEG